MRGDGMGREIDLEPTASNEPAEMSTSELVKELVKHTRELVREEMKLARLELEEEGRQIGEIRDDGRSLVEEARERVRMEVELAGEDLRATAQRAKRAAVPIAAGGVLLHAGIFLALFTLVFGLATFMPLWLAALLVTVLTLAVGGLLTAKGTSTAKQLKQNPLQRTTTKIKEDGRWIRKTLADLKERTRETLRDVKSTLKETVSRRSLQS